jgi:SAM-dependent methyltransferase
MKPFRLRYELFGWDYPFFNSIKSDDFVWIRNYAGKTSLPVLELACGSGRILSILAEDGFEVYGLDISPTMLKLAQENILSLSPAARKKIFLTKGDMRNFEFSFKFGLIYIVDHSFSEIQTKNDQIKCLKSIYSHLSDDGYFLIEFYEYDLQLLKTKDFESGWSETCSNIFGQKISRKVRTHLNLSENIIEGQMLYRVLAENQEQIEIFSFHSLPMTFKDYEMLLLETGFKPKMIDHQNHRIRMAARKIRS